jgi:AcrR family transcriptional regulator
LEDDSRRAEAGPADAPADTASRCCGPTTRAERKSEQVLDGARAVILARGFEGASVDDIAREAGVSKATMYRYYPDKSALFAAVMHRDCARQSEALHGIEADGRPLEEILVELGQRYIAFVVSPLAQGMFRTAVAESERFPEVGRAFYESGLDRGRCWLAPLIAAAAARGEVAVDDPDLAAHRFFVLCQAEVFFKRLFGIVETYAPADIEARARDTAAAFLRMYRPD